MFSRLELASDRFYELKQRVRSALLTCDVDDEEFGDLLWDNDDDDDDV